MNRKLNDIGFIQYSKTDQYIYYTISNKLFVVAAIYVDDIFIFSDTEDEVHRLISILRSYFDLKDLGLMKSCLGLTVKLAKDSSELSIKQEAYANKVLKRRKSVNPLPFPNKKLYKI